MKFSHILMTIDRNTRIRLVVKMYGLKFSTEHYAEYFPDSDENEELLDREVTDIRVTDGLLEVVLK